MLIGIDLGGTNIGIGMVDDDCNIVYKTSMATKKEGTYKEIVFDIASLVTQTLKATGINKEKIEGVGIGVPGIVDPVTGIVIEVVNLGWKNVDIVKDLSELLGLAVFVGNDATVAGVAEHAIGAMKGYNSGVLLTLGTGIGAGIIINNKVFEGCHGIGSEIGHMIVGENYYNCNCGRNGCLETFASSTAIINYAKKLINDGEKTIITSMIDDDLNSIDGRLIFEAAKLGDALALKVIDRMTTYLAIGIINTTTVIDPEVFVLGGGLSAAGSFLLERVKEKSERFKYFKGAKWGEIKLSTIGNDGGIIGAAQLCRHKAI